MTKLALIAATMEELARLVLLESRDGEEDAWSAAVDPPDEASEAQLGYLAAKLRRTHPTTLNGATLWSRAVYPLLELAETDQ